MEEKSLMSEEEFAKFIKTISQYKPYTSLASSKFKSVGRAIRRGLVSPYGDVYPKRPFNNRTSKNGTRPYNELKKKMYEQLKSKG